MSDIVIDANVWAMADRMITEGLPIEEEDCIKACRDWLEQFVDGDDRLVVDWGYAIISECRRNISEDGFAVQFLNRLESESRIRFTGVVVDFDRDRHAILPEDLTIGDPADRKYVAAAMQCDPFATIFNATDTDWSNEREMLAEFGIPVVELCDDYIEKIKTTS